MFSNIVLLESVELEYHNEWGALKSPSMMVPVVIVRDGLHPPVQELVGVCRRW